MNDSLLIEQLTHKVNKLQISFDSLVQSSSLGQLSYELHQKQDIISKVNEFYDSAWLKLIIVISILGVLVPIVAQYFQRKNLKDLAEFIRNQMNDNFNLQIGELKNYNKANIDESLSKLNQNIASVEKQNHNLLIELDATTFYLQGLTTAIDNKYSLAITSFINSAYLWLQSERPERCKVIFVNLKLCLRKVIDKEELEISSRRLKESIYNMSIEEMMEYFNNNANKEIYNDQLEQVRKEIQRIKTST
jgi:hypothetical protein